MQSWFDRAETLDAEDDAKHGAERSGDELPDWVINKEQRRQRIQAAMAQLEAEAAQEPEDDPPPTSGGPRPRKRDEAGMKPADKKQLNFTDPESKILKTSDGFVQGYNCQAAVDAAAQIIVAHDVVADQNDSRQLVGMVDRIRRSTGRNPRELSADNGYLSEDNLAALRRRRISSYIATGKELNTPRAAPRRAPNRGPLTKEMRRRIRRGGFRSRYRLRKQTVEPVFGHVKHCRGFSRFSMRGGLAAASEWAMVCTAHNLLKPARC